MAKRKEIIVVTGDRGIIDEFIETSDKNSYAIVGKVNDASPRTPLAGMKKISVVPRTASYGCELTMSAHETKKKNLIALDRSLPSSALIFSSSITISASEQASWINHPERLIGISAFPTLLRHKLIELAPTITTSKSAVQQAAVFFKSIGKESTIVQDRVGMVMPRILCMLINEAAFASGEQLASPRDIDTAMRLGTNYPFGPMEWADKIGIRNIVFVLDALYDDLHEERYRIAPLLKQLAIGKKWWSA